MCLCAACGTHAAGEPKESTSQMESMVEPSEEVRVEATVTPIEISTTSCPKPSEEVTEGTEPEPVKYYTDLDAAYIAKVLWKECGGVPSDTEKACVAWCILNRVDSSGNSIYEVVSAPNQFAYYETTEVHTDLLELAYDVLQRWNEEKNGATDVGRVLPQEYMWFHGDGKHNYFRNAFSGNYTVWDYSLESPYES